MKKIVICYFVVFVLLFSGISYSETIDNENGNRADPYFDYVELLLSTTKTLTIRAQANDTYTIRTYRCCLYQYNGSNWSYVKDLSIPSDVVVDDLYSVAIDYTNEITGSGTYRIKVYLYANTHSYNKNSNSRTY